MGRTIQLNKHPYTILGVAPRIHGTELFYAPDFWVPMVDQEHVDGWSAEIARQPRPGSDRAFEERVWVRQRRQPRI